MPATHSPTAHTATVCADCGGPLTQAFAASEDYDRCRRCGHVFTAASPR